MRGSDGVEGGGDVRVEQTRSFQSVLASRASVEKVLFSI